MAAAGMVSSGGDKLFAYQLGVIALGGLMFGYQLGVSGGVISMDLFLKELFPNVYLEESQYCKFDSALLTLFTSSLYLAAFVSCLCASTITRVFGRRVTTRGCGFLFLVGVLFNVKARNVGMLIAGRLLLGFVTGFANRAVIPEIARLAEAETHSCVQRGGPSTLLQYAITAGICIAGLFNYMLGLNSEDVDPDDWRFSLAPPAIAALMIIVASFFLHDTLPNSALIDEQVQDPWKMLLTRKYRPQLIFAICIPAFQQLTGINVIIFYAPVLFRTVGFGSSASRGYALITYAVHLLATGVSVDALTGVYNRGRRWFFFVGGVQMFISQVAVGGLMAWKYDELSKGFDRILVLLICVYVSGFGWSWGPLGWLVPSEIFPLEVRSAAQAVNFSVNMIFTFAIAQLFPLMLCYMKFGLFFFFSFFLFVMSCFIYKYMPETTGVPLDEMGRVWEQHLVWSKYVVQDEGIATSKPAQDA